MLHIRTFSSFFLGDLSDNHDLMSVKVYELDTPEASSGDSEDRSKIEPSSSFFASPRDHVDDPK